MAVKYGANQNLEDELKTINGLIKNRAAMEEKAEADILTKRLNNLKLTEDLEIKRINKTKNAQLQSEQAILNAKIANIETATQIEAAKRKQSEKVKLAADKRLLDIQLANIQAKHDFEVAKMLEGQEIEMQAETDLYKYKAELLNQQTKAEIDAINKVQKIKLSRQQEITTNQNIAVEAAAQAEVDKENKKRKKKGQKALTPEEEKDIKDKFKANQALVDKIKKRAEKQTKTKQRAQDQKSARENRDVTTKALTGKGMTFTERAAALNSMVRNQDGSVNAKAALVAVANAMSDFAKQLESQINEIASKQSGVDTRLQGSKNKSKWYLGGQSYWEAMLKDVVAVAGASPFIKQSVLTGNIEEFVKKGISFDVEQRAFLQTISDKIANTFNAADASLLRLVRIQQEDTTASRLGMESALTAFLNNMYETTEYMSGLASQVRANLVEAQSLASGKAGVELEWQVQKWLGSLSSVGMSDQAVQTLSQTIGNLAAGKVESITQGGTGNLAVMAANRAGISISDILAGGLDANKTNQLMNAMVDYMAEMYNESGGANNRVVAQQLANVFGVSASDLKSAVNLSSSRGAVAGKNLTNKDMLSRLQSMYNTMGQRTSMGEMLTNLKDNLKYTLSSGIASNPALYALYTASGILDDVAGGIALPDIKVMGSGVNLQTTVSDLMRVVSLSGSLISGGIGMISGLAKGGFNGLKIMDIDTTGATSNMVTRGTGENIRGSTSGFATSESGAYAGNSDSGDVQAATLNGAKDDANSQYVEAQESEDADTKNKVIDEHIVQIYQLLESVINGGSSIKVSPDGGMSWSGIMGGNGMLP